MAGGGFDTKLVRNAAKNYSGFQDRAVTISREARSDPDVRQTFLNMLDSLPEHTLVDQNTNCPFGEFTISFYQQQITVERGSYRLFDERLPRAFYMHELQIGRFQLHGRDLLVFLTKSRATTGLYFIGLYSTSGQRLLTMTTSVGEAWDCRLEPAGLTLLCPSQRLSIDVSAETKMTPQNRP